MARRDKRKPAPVARAPRTVEALDRARAIQLEALALLARQLRPRDVARHLAKLHGLKRRQADRYVVKALGELQRDLSPEVGEPIDSVRARIITGYELWHALALGRTKSVKQAVYDEQGKWVGFEDVERPDPDTASGPKILGALAVVRGVVGPTLRDHLGDAVKQPPALPAKAGGGG